MPRSEIAEAQYHAADERDDEHGIKGLCLLCVAGVPGGEHRRFEYHEIISKAKLPGPVLIAILYALVNIAPACRRHHTAFQAMPEIWLRAMLKVGLATWNDYADYPYSTYLPVGQEGAGNPQDIYPPFQDCKGMYGYGDTFFRSRDGIPASIVAVYAGTNDVRSDFCEMCPARIECQAMWNQTIERTKKNARI